MHIALPYRKYRILYSYKHNPIAMSIHFNANLYRIHKQYTYKQYALHSTPTFFVFYIFFYDIERKCFFFAGCFAFADNRKLTFLLFFQF